MEHDDKKNGDRHDIATDSERGTHSETNDSNVCDVCGKEMKSEKSVRYHKLRAHSKPKPKKKTPANNTKHDKNYDEPTSANSYSPQYDEDESDDESDVDELDEIFDEIKNTSTKEYPSILLQMGKTLRNLGCSYPDTKQILTLMEDADPDNLDDFMEVSRDVRLNTNLRRMFVQKWAKIRGLKIGRDIEKILGITRKHDYSYDDEYDDEDDSSETQVTSSSNEFAENLKAVLDVIDRTNLRGGNSTDPETQRQIEELKIQNAKLEATLEREQQEQKFKELINNETKSFKEQLEKVQKENQDFATTVYKDISGKLDGFLAVRQKFLVGGDEKPPYKETKSSRQYDEIADDVNPKYRRVFNPVNSTFEKQKEIENGQAK